MMSWLGSIDPDLSKVGEFIDRRLNNVKLIGTITKPLKKKMKSPLDIFSKFPFFDFNR